MTNKLADNKDIIYIIIAVILIIIAGLSYSSGTVNLAILTLILLLITLVPIIRYLAPIILQWLYQRKTSAKSIYDKWHDNEKEFQKVLQKYSFDPDYAIPKGYMPTRTQGTEKDITLFEITKKDLQKYSEDNPIYRDYPYNSIVIEYQESTNKIRSTYTNQTIEQVLELYEKHREIIIAEKKTQFILPESIQKITYPTEQGLTITKPSENK